MTPPGIVLAGALALALYTYVGYPLALKALASWRPRLPSAEYGGDDWPRVSISVPVYNEEHQIAETIESLLALDYPRDRLQIVIVSDASSDRTDAVARSYAARGVQLVRAPERLGKTGAEKVAAAHLSGEIVVNTDASIRILPTSLKALIAPFKDATVGLASGRDLSVAPDSREANQGEAGYVGYEMWVRAMETRVGGIVGASGCFYAIRKPLHTIALPDSLSRDFAAALHTLERGYRAISVPAATCLVPRASSLKHEYPRKVRTMVRGMKTLLHKRALLNPLRHGLFSWMLLSHKCCRWLVPWAQVAGLASLAILAGSHPWAAIGLALALAGMVVGAVGWAAAADRGMPSVVAVPAYGLMGSVAALNAALRVLLASKSATWEPTRRTAENGAGAA